jgi:hypothetical protein
MGLGRRAGILVGNAMRNKLFVMVLLLGAAFGQTARFDGATIKTSLPLAALRAAGRMPHEGMRVSADRVEFESAPLSYLIRLAYKIEDYQVSGPDFMDRQRFDIIARMPGGEGPEQIPEMLQALLAERFKLVVRKETKEQTVYALVVGKDGPKMKEAEAGGSGATMPDLARMLKRYFDEPVIDRTGLEGTYQVSMNVSRTDEIFASVEKLGLRLEKTQALMEYIVVEHLEKSPTEK